MFKIKLKEEIIKLSIARISGTKKEFSGVVKYQICQVFRLILFVEKPQKTAWSHCVMFHILIHAIKMVSESCLHIVRSRTVIASPYNPHCGFTFCVDCKTFLIYLFKGLSHQ